MKTKSPSKQNKLYGVWCAMKHRCSNPKFKDYYGRGIRVCEEWQIFKPFEEWSKANGYREGLSIDRIDNDGNYCPENCRWTDKITQENNRRNNIQLEYKGEIKTISEWSRICGIKPWTINQRIRVGWSVEDALTVIPNHANCHKEYYKKH